MITIPYYETSGFVFSNFSAHAVEINGIIYMTAEHAYHAQKFSDPRLKERIRSCRSPLEAWKIARRLKSQRVDDWDDVKVETLKNIIRQKVLQNPEVRDALLGTKDEDIVEINPNDAFWGCGPDGNGQNMTGKLLMSIRDELRD